MANKKRKKKRMSKKKKILIFILEILVLLILLGVLYVYNMLSKIEFQNMTDSEAGINEDLNSETAFAMEGYTNIALFGLDNHEAGNYESGQSDAIMIASINNKTKDVKLVSVYRDTFLSVGGGEYFKCNAAYNRGGPKQAVQMLNSNLDLDITEYVTVDWAALAEVIDGLGGLDLEITEEEVDALNLCIPEIDEVTGKSTPWISQAGMNHLDGTQSTAYARIRHTSGDDFRRAARQRIVLQAMLDKAKHSDLITLTEVANTVFDHISTSLSLKQILLLAKDVANYNLVETTGFPYNLTTKVLNHSGDTIIPVDLVTNVTDLHVKLFEQPDYTPSTTVQSISDNIVDMTGISLEYGDVYNLDKYNDTLNKNGTGEKPDTTETEEDEDNN